MVLTRRGNPWNLDISQINRAILTWKICITFTSSCIQAAPLNPWCAISWTIYLNLAKFTHKTRIAATILHSNAKSVIVATIVFANSWIEAIVTPPWWITNTSPQSIICASSVLIARERASITSVEYPHIVIAFLESFTTSKIKN